MVVGLGSSSSRRLWPSRAAPIVIAAFGFRLEDAIRKNEAVIGRIEGKCLQLNGLNVGREVHFHGLRGQRKILAIILLAGDTKKRQQEDIRRANVIWEDYRCRKDLRK